MVSYQMMDSQTLLGTCLHGGPINISRLHQSDLTKEEEIQKYLVESIEIYDSCAVLALDGSEVIGLLRFYPDEVFDLMQRSVCIHKKSTQEAYQELPSLPSREDLEEQHLRIECMQLVTNYYDHDGKDYGNQGIGKRMLETLIEWAQENEWHKISYQGINLYPPVLHWTGLYPKDSLISLGFEVDSVHVSESLKEGINNQIKGFHGKEIQDVWEEYGEVDVDEAAEVYHVTLKLQ